MTTAHKNLTSTDLHESKGVSSAAINKVYVTDGAGSGTWQKITSSQLDATAGGNSFGGALLHVKDEKTSGTAGGTFTAGAWRTRTLNTTKTNEISGASLASNQITLPAGTYYCEAYAVAFRTLQTLIKLKDVTSGTDLLTGCSLIFDTTAAQSQPQFVSGRFTLAGTKAVELQHISSGTSGTQGFGYPTSLGTETYADVKIWKL